jgi:helicase
LSKEIWAVDEQEDIDTAIARHCVEVLKKPDTSLLIFVYQTRCADELAARLNANLGEAAGPEGVKAFHSRMPAAQRDAVRDAVMGGRSRCVVTTTALAMGVNLPATHVIVRDTTFRPHGKLGVAEILQMIGRAGRGDSEGHAVVVLRPTDTWNADELTSALVSEHLPEITSHFDRVRTIGFGPNGRSQRDTEAVATQVAALISRRGGAATLREIEEFFARSLGGSALTGAVGPAAQWLCDPLRMLAYQDESSAYRLTVLGEKATQAILPLAAAAGIAQLIRDLLELDPTDTLLKRWQLIDHLVVLDLLSERAPNLRQFSGGLADRVDGWMEAQPGEASLLYTEWLKGAQGSSRAAEVLGSLGLASPRGANDPDEWARRAGYLALFRGILLLDRASGASIEDLTRRWETDGLAGREEAWRDNVLWLLSGLRRVLDVRCFYYHLQEIGSSTDRVANVKRILAQWRNQTVELQERVKFCSALGPLLRSIRETQASDVRSVGVNSIRRLEASGIKSLAELAPLTEDELVAAGVQRQFAKQIRRYVRRRLQ